MGLNLFLKSRIDDAKALVEELKKEYDYVSVLGSSTKITRIVSSTYSSSVNSSENDCGFVIKLYNGSFYSEYACDDIRGLKAADVKKAAALDGLKQKSVQTAPLNEEELTKSFVRDDKSPLESDDIMARMTALRQRAEKYDDKIIDVNVMHLKREVSEIFVSDKKCLDQFYVWVNFRLRSTVRDGDNIKSGSDSSNGCDTAAALSGLEGKWQRICDKSLMLLKSKPIKPGTYDIITHPYISGLIAHEAFGHGVEMDMFVKHRAKAANYVGKYVASEHVNMRDGASGILSAGSYFFDDDGVLAHNTEIIRDGILVTGISDTLSALELGTEPTGNGRRENFAHKSYTRMTNTYFCAGDDKLENMIASIDHGYILYDCSNGMEDPKNWQIQCTAEYAVEIEHGRLTDNIVSPVVISGSVLDLLGSVSMVSEEFEMDGIGMCGKGYKEWVFVADGGPYLKARAKLG